MSTGAAALPSLTEHVLLGLLYIQRYRFLSVAQFARIARLREKTASETLLRFERRGLLSHFGNTGIRGYGKTPKLYYLKRKGYDILLAESGLDVETIGTFKETHVNTRWSPQMFHRLATLDALVSLEVAVADRPKLGLVETFIEYRRVRVGGQWRAETTDFVAPEETSENRLVPDAGFILENIESEQRALFLVEIDMGTERIISRLPGGAQYSLHHKLRQYDRYLMGGRFAETYKQWGAFKSFTLLFMTTTDARVDNIRTELATLPEQLHRYYRFNTLEAVFADFFNGDWRARSITDQARYSIVRSEKGEGA